MIKAPRFFLVLGCFCLFISSSCSKKEIVEVDNETQSAVDYAIADQEFMGLISAAARSALLYTTTGVPNYYYVPNSYHMPDGKERVVTLGARLNGQAKIPGAQTIYKILECTAAGIVYTCDSIILTTIESTNSYSSFNVKLINGVCKTSNYTIKYKFDRTFIIYPDSTSARLITHVFGTASGTNRVNKNFSTIVLQTEALVKRENCAFIGSGIMELTPEGFKSRTINFGDGSCDDQATFTVKENTVAFKLK